MQISSLSRIRAAGWGLFQLLREHPRLNVIGRRPKDDVTRAGSKPAAFCCRSKQFANFETELLAFPDGKHDDQVDAFMLFLDWFSENEAYINPVLVSPISITRAYLGLDPLIRDWSCHY